MLHCRRFAVDPCRTSPRHSWGPLVMHDAGPRFGCCSRDENRQSQQHSKLPRLHANAPSSCRCSRDWSIHDALRTRGGERYHPVAVRRDDGHHPPQLPDPKPERRTHRDDPIRSPNRGRRPITRSDQETMGSPDDLLSPIAAGQTRDRAPVPHLGRRRRAPMASPPRPRRGGMRAEGPSSAPRRRGHGSARPRCRRSCWRLRHVARCLKFVRAFGDGKGVRTRRTPLGTACVFLVAGTGFEPVTSGL